MQVFQNSLFRVKQSQSCPTISDGYYSQAKGSGGADCELAQGISLTVHVCRIENILQSRL